MRLKARTVILISFVLIFCFSGAIESQVVVERSGEKAIIAGKAYYIHTVKKGETVYSIAKAYGITEIELTKENSSALYGIKEGQTLKIPVEEPAQTEVKKDETNYIYHKLGPGETIYSLSKIYDVSEDQIISSNPNIDIYKLAVGAEIAIPKKGLMAEQQKFENQDNNFIFHKVLKGETLSSIARQYGITLRELRQENNGILFPKANEYLRIPKKITTEQTANATAPVDTTKTEVAAESTVPVGPAEHTVLNKLKGTINVAVLLPFYLDENSIRTEIDSSQMIKGKKVYKTVRRSDNWIYSGSDNFIEMYEGILLAVDTLRSLGLSVNINTFDIKSDSIALKLLIESDRLRSMDLIIGPVYSSNLSIMAAYGRKYDIPVVSPVPLKNTSALINNPNVFIVNPSLEAAQAALAHKIADYSDYNLVFIHADSAKTDPDVINFKDAIFKELRYKLPYEEIRFREFVFYNRSAFDNDSINRLGHALSAERKNLVIIASEDPPVMDETITNLDALAKQYDISIIGYPAMRGLKNTDLKYFFDNGIMLYSPFWIDIQKPDVKQFIKKFRLKFYTEPVETSFAWQGYDLAYYFMSGIALDGKSFQNKVASHNPELLASEYVFQQKSPSDGYENRHLFLIEYSKDMNLVNLEENSDNQASIGNN